MKIKSFILSNEMYVLLDRISGMFSGIISLLFVFTFFNISDGARYFTFSALIGLFTQLAYFGIKQIYLREYNNAKYFLNKYQFTVMIFLSITTIISVFFISAISYFFLNMSIIHVLEIILLSIFIPINIFEMSLYGEKDYKIIASIKVITLILFSGIKGLGAYVQSIDLFIFFIVLEIIARNIGYFLMYRRKYNFQLSNTCSFNDIDMIYQTSKLSFVNMILNIGTGRILILLVASIGSSYDTYILGFAVKVLDMLNLIANSLMMPRVVKFYEDKVVEKIDKGGIKVFNFGSIILFMISISSYFVCSIYDVIEIPSLVYILGVGVCSLFSLLNFITDQKLIQLNKVSTINVGACFIFTSNILFALVFLAWGLMPALFYTMAIILLFRDILLFKFLLNSYDEKIVNSHYPHYGRRGRNEG